MSARPPGRKRIQSAVRLLDAAWIHARRKGYRQVEIGLALSTLTGKPYRELKPKLGRRTYGA